jgi:hypothetical protein
MLTKDGLNFLRQAKNFHGGELSAVDTSEQDDLTWPIVRLVSNLTWSERARKYGIKGMLPDGQSQEQFITNHCKVYGDEYETITVEPERGHDFLKAINGAGARMADFINKGEYRTTNLSPQNPNISGTPAYFSIPAAGWGSGWQVGNTLIKDAHEENG